MSFQNSIQGDYLTTLRFYTYCKSYSYIQLINIISTEGETPDWGNLGIINFKMGDRPQCPAHLNQNFINRNRCDTFDQKCIFYWNEIWNRYSNSEKVVIKTCVWVVINTFLAWPNLIFVSIPKIKTKMQPFGKNRKI